MKAWSVFLATVVGAAIFCALAAMRMWPLIDGDGPAYFPAAVEWSAGHALTNPVWPSPLNDTIDGPGGRRFTYHGFAYPLVVGDLARLMGGGPEPTVAAAYLVHFLAACLSAMAVLSWASAEPPLRLVMACLLVPAMLALSLAWHGRVEPLAMLIVASGLIGWRVVSVPEWRAVVGGAAASLLLFTSPVAGGLACCVVGAAMAASLDQIPAWRMTAHAAAGAAVMASICVAAYPFPIADWIAGVSRHSAINLSLPAAQGFQATWLTRPDLPLLIVTFSVFTVGACLTLNQLGRSIGRARRAWCALFLAAFTLGLLRVAFVKTEASYNATIWMPLLASLAFAVPMTRARRYLSLLGLALLAAGAVRSSVMLAAQFRPQAVQFGEVRDVLRTLPPGRFVVSSGLWLASDDPQASIDRGALPPPQFRVEQQANRGLQVPAELAGYRLLVNRFGRRVELLSLPLSRTPGGYEFAVYERIESSPGQ